MSMLTIETFLLLLLSGLLGLAVGHLAAIGHPAPAADPDAALRLSSDRPWLRDLRSAPPAPQLPSPPALLDAAERARLTALAASQATPIAPVAPPLPTVAVAPPPPAPSIVTPEPPPTIAPTPFDAFTLPPAVAAAAVTPTIAAADAGRAAEADAVGTRPMALAAPRAAMADDLKRIKGIGPQNEKRLNALGIFHFAQVAAWTPENARWAGSFLAFHGRIEREDWIGQAKILATGAATDFAKRVDAGEVPTSQAPKKH